MPATPSRLGRHRRAALGASAAILAAAAGTSVALAGGAASAGATKRTSAHDRQARSSNSAMSLQDAYVHVVKQVRGSVVQITTASGLGSGIVYDKAGDIVTNDHVVLNAKTVQVQFVSGTTAKAKVVGSFAPDDLAVVKIGDAKKSDLNPASFANMSRVSVGDIVLAIGSPLAFASSVTDGIVSALGRTVVEPTGSHSPGGVIANAVQTSAPINPGNSGGALVNLQGKVVGIPTLAAQDPQIGGQAVGIGFAIPANTVTDIAGQIIKHGHVTNSHRADLGIYSYQATNSSGQPVGVAVARVQASGPAAKAGISAGDVITAINKTQTITTGALETVLAKMKPGQKVTVHVLKPTGKKTTDTLTLGTLPASS